MKSKFWTFETCDEEAFTSLLVCIHSLEDLGIISRLTVSTTDRFGQKTRYRFKTFQLKVAFFVSWNPITPDAFWLRIDKNPYIHEETFPSDTEINPN